MVQSTLQLTVQYYVVTQVEKKLLNSLLPARASEQGNVIGLVSVYIYIYLCTIKIVIERTRDLFYLKFVATDFLKIISPSASENSGGSAYPLLFRSYALLMNPLPDHSNYSPLLDLYIFSNPFQPCW